MVAASHLKWAAARAGPGKQTSSFFLTQLQGVYIMPGDSFISYASLLYVALDWTSAFTPRQLG